MAAAVIATPALLSLAALVPGMGACVACSSAPILTTAFAMPARWPCSRRRAPLALVSNDVPDAPRPDDAASPAHPHEPRPWLQLVALLMAFAIHVALSSYSLRVSLPAVGGLPASWVVHGEDALSGAAAFGALALTTRRLGRLSAAPARPWAEPSQSREELLGVVGALLTAYGLSGVTSSVCAAGLRRLAAAGLPLSPAWQGALHTLSTHTAWLLMACTLLGRRLRPFWPQPIGYGEWFTVRWRSRWLGWAIAGYLASVTGYNAIDGLRGLLERLSLSAGAGAEAESLVTSLVGDGAERTELGALVVGCLAPCLSAPFLEEVLYRGFLLPALARSMPLRWAMLAQALLFGAHHHSWSTMLPLSALGWLWSALYLRSGNLLVPILVHALWNARVFAHAC